MRGSLANEGERQVSGQLECSLTTTMTTAKQAEKELSPTNIYLVLIVCQDYTAH